MEGAGHMAEITDRELLLEMRGDLKEVRRQVTATNGRVTELETWRRQVELREAHEEGEREGVASVGAVITRSQLAVLGAAMGVVGAAAGVIARFWP